MSPRTKEPVAEETDRAEVIEITEEGYPEWHGLVVEAMEEVKSGDIERWP